MDLALFDFDGTLTTKDTFRGFLYFSSSRARIAAGTVVLGPLLLGFRRGMVSGAVLRRASALFCFRNRNVEEIDEQGRRYARTFGTMLRPRALARLEWHQARGDRVVIVSASLSTYLRPFAESLGVELICTELDARDRVHTGLFRGGDCSGEEKARRVRTRFELRDYASVHAYGDTHEDHALLRLANHRYFCGREVDPSVPVESLRRLPG
ncbi:MAG TPA: HAD-IB family hydrolase [Polyangiaceae bacterium]